MSYLILKAITCPGQAELYPDTPYPDLNATVRIMADNGGPPDDAALAPRPRMKPLLLYEEILLGGVTTLVL